MTRNRFLVSGLIACLLTATLVLAAPATAPENLTVGDFAALIASRISSDGVVRPVTPEGAAEILKKSGIQLKKSLSSPLTEADAADLFKQYGITLQVQDAGALLSRDRAEALVGVFGSTLTAAAYNKSAGVKLDSKANSLKPGTTSSVSVDTATTLIECQSLPRAPSPCDGPFSVCNPCMDCCLNDLGLTGKTCGHACQKRNLVTTPSDPTP